MELGEGSSQPIAGFFQEMGIEQPINLEVTKLGGKRFHRGREGTVKYSDLDISSHRLGHQQGFLSLDSGDGSEIKKRYEKWKLLQSDGFSGDTFELCLPVVAKDQQGVNRFGLLTEDLVSENSAIIDLVSYRTGERPAIMAEAAIWLHNFMGKLQIGDVRSNIQGISNVTLKAALIRQYDRHVGGKSRATMPGWDPFVEEQAEDLSSNLEKRGWKATGDNFFLQISRFHQDWWPYRRKLLIGDLGIGLEKSSPARVERGQMYDLIQYSYFS